MTNIKSEYNHVEAFMLMKYSCHCGHCEIAWNSRDGITPFCIMCPSCGKASLSHAYWHNDVRAVDYKPNKGQLVFH